jgi:uncharacterized membrane protein YjjB (DUF3815 family)
MNQGWTWKKAVVGFMIAHMAPLVPTSAATQAMQATAGQASNRGLLEQS